MKVTYYYNETKECDACKKRSRFRVYGYIVGGFAFNVTYTTHKGKKVNDLNCPKCGKRHKIDFFIRPPVRQSFHIVGRGRQYFEV